MDVHNFKEYANNIPKGIYSSQEEYELDEPEICADKKTYIKYGILSGLLCSLISCLAFINSTLVILSCVGLCLIQYEIIKKDKFQYKSLIPCALINISISLLFSVIMTIIIYSKQYLYFLSGFLVFLPLSMIVQLIFTLTTFLKSRKYVNFVRNDILNTYKLTHPNYKVDITSDSDSSMVYYYILPNQKFDNNYQRLIQRYNYIKQIDKNNIEPYCIAPPDEKVLFKEEQLLNVYFVVKEI